MKSSIIVCTYNRAESLQDTLRALQALKTPPSCSWEVIVVDNNSNDHTRTIVEEAQADWPELRYEFEQAQGLSHARNHGILASRGEILLFTDDDVLPEPDWLETTITGLEIHNADACGGYIAPIWETAPPAWLTERFYGFLAVRTDRTDDYVITESSQAPFGANMVVKRQLFDAIGMFDTGRGRKGNTLASGEDGELFERILAAGYKAVFLGQSRVHHKVEAFRETKAYFRRWRYQTSRNLAITKGMPGDRRIFNIPVYLWPQLFRAVMRAIIAKFTKPADEAFYDEIIVCHFLGTIQGLLQSR